MKITSNAFLRSLLASALLSPLHAQLYWDGSATQTADADGGTGTWDSSSANWADAATAGNNLPWAPDQTAVFGPTAGTVTLQSAGISAAGLNFQTSGYNLTGATLTLGTGTVHVAVGTATVQSAIAGTNGLTKTGSGTLMLTASSSYSGPTTINGGFLVAGVLAANGSNSSIGTGSSLILDGATFRYPSTSGNNNSFNRNITLAGDSIIDTTTGGFLFASGVISGPGALTKTGARQLIATGTNTYQGETFIQAGELQFRNLATFGTTSAGTTVADGAQVAASVNGTIHEPFTITGLGRADLAIADRRGALQSVDSATIVYAGPITLESIAAVGGTRPFTITGTISGPGSLAKIGSTTAANSVTLAGDHPNTYAGTTILGGSGRLVLAKPAGVNAIPDNVLLSSTAWNGQNAGIVLANNEQIANHAVLTWTTASYPTNGAQEDTFFRLNGYTETIGGLNFPSGNGGKAVIENRGFGDANSYPTGHLIIHVAEGTGPFTYIGGIRNTDGGSTGGVAITKSGPGMQTLGGGMSSATGALTVLDGILRLNGNLGSATSTVTGSGRLEGTGTLSGGSLQVHSGGVFAPGIEGSGTFSAAAPVSIGENGRLSLASATLSGSAILGSGGTLTGQGTITSGLTVQAGGQLLPGPTSGGIGTIQILGAVQLAGTSTFQITKSAGTASSDALAGFTAIQFGGDLILEWLDQGEPLELGDEFALFNSATATYAGNFSSISGLPELPPGLQWETTTLLTNGTIRIVDTTSTPSFSPASGGYVGPQSVTISSDSGATVYYTLDGSEPTESSPSGLSPVTGVPVPGNGVGFTIKARAKHPDFSWSATATATYNTVPDAPKWNVDNNGFWSDSANWLNQVVPNGAGMIADFTLPQTAPAEVSLDGNRTVGGLVFANPEGHPWKLTGSNFLSLDTAAESPTLEIRNVQTSIEVVLAGTKGFTKTGIGNLLLTAPNTFIGETVFRDGIVTVNSLAGNGTPSPLGAGTSLTLDGGMLRYTGLGGNILNNQFNRIVTLGPSGGTLDAQGAGFWFTSGTFTGPGPLTKTGERQLIIASANSHEGTTFVEQAEVQFRSLEAFGSPAAGTVVADGARVCAGGGLTGTILEPFTLRGDGGGNGALQANDGGTTITYAGPITLAADSGFGGGQAFTVSGPVSGPGGLTKLTANTVTFTGALSYEGATRVNAGTLQIAGTTSGPLEVTPGAVLSPAGASPGTFACGSATIQGTYAFQISAATSDSLVVNGNLDISGATLALSVLTTPTTPSYVIASYTGTRTGTFQVSGTLPEGYELEYDDENRRIILSKPAGYADFASTYGLSGNPADDFDADGLPDGVEYVLGTHPAQAGDSPPAFRLEGENMLFTFTRHHRSLADATVTVETSTDLATWPDSYLVAATTAASSPGITVSPGTLPDTDEIILSVLRAPHDTRFARLKVLLTTP
jgi:autotransporter-associated beta strand protein